MRLQLGVLVFYEGSDDYSIRLLKQNTVEVVSLLQRKQYRSSVCISV